MGAMETHKMTSILKFLRLQNGAFADLFVVDGGEGFFQLHRVIVCAQSTKFMEICGKSSMTVRVLID